MELKEGDQVKYVGGTFRMLTKGKSYSVERYFPETGIFYTKDDNGTPRGFIFPNCKFGWWKVVSNEK